MRRLVVVGAGGHGKVVADAAEQMNQWKEILFMDKSGSLITHCGPWSVVSEDKISDLLDGSVDFVVAIGDNLKRFRIFEQLQNLGLRPVSVIHPSAAVSRYAELGAGSVVFAGAVINIDAKVGACSIVNTGATIDHDCVIGCSVHISPGANLAGDVSVGDFSWIGIGASVKQCVTITGNVVVGAGACVVANIAEPGVYIGIPAKKNSYS